MELSIDVETFSDVDLGKCGTAKYVESPNFEILILCYSINGGPVESLDLTNKKLLELFILWLLDPAVIKTAHNAPFERQALAAYFKIDLPAEQWRCTMVLAAMCGYPMGLDKVGKALGLDTEKDARGKSLITFFTKPCKPTIKNGQRTRNLPEHDPEKFSDFIEYCKQDVRQELKVKEALSYFKVTKFEQALWNLDQKINQRGVRVSKKFARNCVRMDYENRKNLVQEITELTKLENPNSPQQLKAWIGDILGYGIVTLAAEFVKSLIKELTAQKDLFPIYVKIARVLEIRQEMAKTSVKKYIKMLDAVCSDGRLKYMLQFFGAGTGRWAGRIIQPHNLPRIMLKVHDLDLARRTVLAGDLDLLVMLYGSVPFTLSQLIRTALIPSPGNRLMMADFSQIEARVLAWLANEKWRLDIFNAGGDIYKASASKMFKVDLADVDDSLRQRGKVAELALGYQGGAGALESMDIQKKIDPDEYEEIVDKWRAANPNIKKYWYGIQDAAIMAVRDSVTVTYGVVRFFVKHKSLFIQLPSGRCLSYPKPVLRPNKWGRDSLWFMGEAENSRAWKLVPTYGGSLTENITQAIARDCLAWAMRRVDKAGYNIVLHVHDELVVDDPVDFGSVEEINEIMKKPIPWAPSLPLSAEAYEAKYYRKD